MLLVDYYLLKNLSQNKKSMKTILLSFLFFLLTNSNLFGQEVSFMGFYQGDLLYNARPGISLSYTENFNDIFSLEFEYGNQYISQRYHISNMEFSSRIDARIFMNNISISPIITVANTKKIQVSIGSKHSLFYILGKEYVESSYYNYIDENHFSIEENNYTRNPKDAYYSYSNELRFKLKEVFIPKMSLNFNLSAGFIFNGSRISGCLVTPTDIWAPYGRIGLGVSYNLSK